MTKVYHFDNQKFTDERQLEAYIIEDYAPANFDAYLDEVYGITTIAGEDYYTSEALYDANPTRYQNELMDWALTIYEEVIESA